MIIGRVKYEYAPGTRHGNATARASLVYPAHRSPVSVPCQLAPRPMRSLTKDHIAPFLCIYPTSYQQEISPKPPQNSITYNRFSHCVLMLVQTSFYVSANNTVHTLRRVCQDSLRKKTVGTNIQVFLYWFAITLCQFCVENRIKLYR